MSAISFKDKPFKRIRQRRRWLFDKNAKLKSKVSFSEFIKLMIAIMPETNKKNWEQKLKKAMKVELEMEARARLKRVWPYLSNQKRAIQVYELVCVWGFSQDQVAEHLGVSQPAVNKALKKFLKKNPDKKSRLFISRIGFLPDGMHAVERL